MANARAISDLTITARNLVYHAARADLYFQAGHALVEGLVEAGMLEVVFDYRDGTCLPDMNVTRFQKHDAISVRASAIALELMGWIDRDSDEVVNKDEFAPGAVVSLKLEERGAYIRNVNRGRTSFRPVAFNRRPWIARIIGTSTRYNLAREFLRPFKDYRDASRSGRSGIHHWFFLRPGIYEVYAVLSSTKTRRYFVKCEGGKISEISRDEVMTWLDS
jgi:hypothetical protein